MKQPIPKIAIISTFPPTQCGIATYSHDLSQSLYTINKSLQIIKLGINPSDLPIVHTDFEIQSDTSADYYNVCEFINSSDIDLVDIQHEFKLYGNPDGENVLILLKQIKKPIFTTLHTVFAKLNPKRENIFIELINRSNKLFVFSDEAKKFIVEKHGKDSSLVEVIPHGVPAIAFKKPEEISIRIPSPIVFVSSGHMRNTKGYDTAIKALYLLKKEGLQFHFLILGSNHPKNETAASYRELLTSLINELELTGQVTFVNEYLETTRLIEYIQSADMCLLPYTGKDQSSSGVLSLMVACGRPVVTTPFQFAKYYVNPSMGIVADAFDHIAFAEALNGLLTIKEQWHEMAIYNHQIGTEWSWEKVGQKYLSGYSEYFTNQID